MGEDPEMTIFFEDHVKLWSTHKTPSAKGRPFLGWSLSLLKPLTPILNDLQSISTNQLSARQSLLLLHRTGIEGFVLRLLL